MADGITISPKQHGSTFGPSQLLEVLSASVIVTSASPTGVGVDLVS